MKRLSVTLFAWGILLAFAPILTAHAQMIAPKTPWSKSPLYKINKHFSTQTTTFSDGVVLERSIISGPHTPPPGYDREREVVSPPKFSAETMTGSLTEVPAFKWVFGCSAVSGAMIAGYYDRTGYPNIYIGPANGGKIPLKEDTSWRDWTDIAGDTYPNNPLIASHKGLDGKAFKGSIDDYWVSYLSGSNDPYVTGGWTEHPWWDAIGDYMKTSQSAWGNDDGSTSFYGYTGSALPLTCSEMETYGIHDEDGTYGRKLFYEARGYEVTDCYAQSTDNAKKGGFSFAQYKVEIDAGRPVLLNLQGHSIVGVGYDDLSKTVYIHDTWDNSVHSMTWGTNYAGMRLLSVSIVNLEGSSPVVTDPDLSGSWANVSWTGTKKGLYSVSGTLNTANTGSVDLANVPVNVYLSSDNSPNQAELVKTYTYRLLAANSTKATSIRLTTTSSPSRKYLIAVIDPSGRIPESDETNNTIAVEVLP